MAGIGIYKQIVVGIAGFAAIASGQTIQRKAVLSGAGAPDRGGECTVQVVVDGAAQVEIRGGDAVLRNVSGQAPQWRRFECTSIMPANAPGFQFQPIDGRGTQQLTGDPRNGGTAVVRIEDPENGPGEYAFRLTWGGSAAPPEQNRYGRNPGPLSDSDSYYRNRDERFRGNDWQSMFFRGIREDLDHVTSGAYPFTGDRARLARTQMELDELQDKLARGFYDERELDEVMGAMRAVLQANSLAPRDRAIVQDDLSRMQDFRARHDDYGARDSGARDYGARDSGARDYGARGDDQQFYRDREQHFSGNSWREAFFQRIRQDLDHAAVDATPFGGDRARLERTQYELNELQQKLGRGYYDERELDEVMGALQAVVASNRLRPGDREILNDDLSRMRDFRMRHEEYGAR